MEYSRLIFRSSAREKAQKMKLVGDLEVTGKKMHDLGWIHGDFLPKYFKKRGGSYIVLAFDWSRKVNSKPKYPWNINEELVKRLRTSKNKYLITK